MRHTLDAAKRQRGAALLLRLSPLRRHAYDTDDAPRAARRCRDYRFRAIRRFDAAMLLFIAEATARHDSFDAAVFHASAP